jgi:pimeloyl-ACP methyl ester carboxylesterase
MGNMARKPRNVATLMSEAEPQPAPKKRLIIFVHGIRDPGFWSQKLRALFEAEGFIAVPIGFYVFDIFRFLLGIRRKAVERVQEQIKAAIDNNRDAEITIIAHSFGTYVVSRILDEDPSLDIARLVMCGGIVRRGYRWDKTVRLNCQGTGRVQVINEHSGRDIWPLFARHATLGFGDSGTIGCQDACVTDRQHDVRHSAYLTEDFAKTYWIPHLARGEPLADPNAQGKASWLFFLNRSPVTLLGLAATALAGFIVYYSFDQISFKTQGTLAQSKTAGVNFHITGKRSPAAASEPIYAAQSPDSPLEYMLLSTSKYQRVRVTIYNRLPIICATGAIENLETTPERSENNRTVYDFDIAGAHRLFGKSQLSFFYEDQVTAPNGQPIDRLTLHAGEGLDPTRIKVRKVTHSDGDCIDVGIPTAGETPYVAVQPFEAGDLAQSGIVGGAFAQYAPKLNRTDVQGYLTSSDPQLQALGLDEVTAKPLENSATVNSIVNQGAVQPEVLAKLLAAARNAPSARIMLNTDRVIELAVGPDPKVRDAARSYLRAPGVVRDDVVRRVEAALKTRLSALGAEPVPGKPYHRDYLLLITARDVYYNLGLQKLEDHMQALFTGRRSDLTPVLAVFEAGRKLRPLAANDRERVSLAKNTYGLALAEFRDSVTRQALAMSGKSSPFDFIQKARAGDAPLDDQRAAKTFKQLLQEVSIDPSLYPWPPHLEQAKRCAARLTFACVGGDIAKE